MDGKTGAEEKSCEEGEWDEVRGTSALTDKRDYVPEPIQRDHVSQGSNC